MIRCLPKEVQGKLRSGVAIPSLQQCVEELVLNCIDAAATCVGVRVDMESLKVQVIDNGSGITAEDLACVGNRYHTSKCSSVEDLDNLKWYGFRGEALASIVSLATLVEISSRTRLSVKTHVKLFKVGKGLDVFESDTPRPSPGTTVIICSLFHNMPVRRKRLNAVLEAERIRQRVEAISLMHPSVSFTLKNDCTGALMVQLPKAKDTYHRFVQIHGIRGEKLVEINHIHRQFELVGYFGKEAHYNNSFQYLYVNERLLLKTRIHKLLNLHLRRLTNSSQKNNSSDGTCVPGSPKLRHNYEQYAVYIVNIKCGFSEYDICLEPTKTLVEFKDWDGVLLCIEEAVKAFLKRENLVSLSSQEASDYAHLNLIETDTIDQEKESGKAELGVNRFPTMDSCSGMKLASKFVHRSSTESIVHQDSALMQCNDTEKSQIGSEHAQQSDLEPALVKTNEDEQTFSKESDGSRILNTPERHKCALSKDDESNLHTFDLKTLQTQIQPSQRELECKKQPVHLIGRKISLSDPYVHKSLQKFRAKTSRNSLPCTQKMLLRLNEETTRDIAPVIPAKIPRAISLQKLSTSQEPGSLDKFRRACAESVEENLLHSDSQSNVDLSQKGLFAMNPDCTSVFRDYLQKSQVPNSKDDHTNPLCLSFDQNKSKISLAGKLCHLKKHLTEPTEAPQTHSATDAAAAQPKPNKTPPLDPACSSKAGVEGIEEERAASDWLHHYDTSVGRTVYVNRVTGLSRYEDPAHKETSARCISDISNMAVSVVSEMDDVNETSNSLFSLYSKWENPVFIHPPAVGLDVSSRQADGLAVKIHSILFPYRFSKPMIHSMKVIHQVDKKFLACLINTTGNEDERSYRETEGNLLVLVDQHAAHERIRLESLVEDSYEDDPDADGQRRLCASSIVPPLEISLTEEQIRLLRSCKGHLRSLGLEVSLSQTAASQAFVGKVPVCFMEKESNELRRGRPSIIKPIVEEYLREQTEFLCSTGRVRGTLPLTVLKVLASLACHGAIKFNSTLSRDECNSLVASLSSCQLPFQCAHGRPSIVPLVDIHHLDNDQKDVQKPNLKKLRRLFKAWELFGDKS